MEASQLDLKKPTPTGADVTNLLLIELLEKQSEKLQKLNKKKENKGDDDSFTLFKKLANLY